MKHWLGVVDHVHLVVLRDRRVAVARRGVVRAQLAVRWAYHLGLWNKIMFIFKFFLTFQIKEKEKRRLSEYWLTDWRINVALIN